MPRSKKVPSETVFVKTGCGNMYVTVGNAPAISEVFLRLGKAGNCIPAWSEALARVISIALQSGTPLAEVVKTLRAIKCPTPLRYPEEDAVESCPDAVARTLMEYIPKEKDES